MADLIKCVWGSGLGGSKDVQCAWGADRKGIWGEYGASNCNQFVALNLADVCRRRAERPLLFALAFDNGLTDRKSAFKKFNCNNQATSSTDLVNFCQKISSVHLVEIW